MFICDDFVFIHFPKTGGTFVQTMLEPMHSRTSHILQRIEDKTGLPLPGTRMYAGSDRRKHDTPANLPDRHKNKPLVSAIRHPIRRKVSLYYFEYWKRHPKKAFPQLDRLRQEYPHFPDLSLDEYVFAADQYSKYANPEVGTYTKKFIEYFAPEVDVYTTEAVRGELPEIHFLRTESLNTDLYEYLTQKSYPADHVLGAGKVRPKTGKENKRETPSEEAEQLIREKDAILFDLFGYE